VAGDRRRRSQGCSGGWWVRRLILLGHAVACGRKRRNKEGPKDQMTEKATTQEIL